MVDSVGDDGGWWGREQGGRRTGSRKAVLPLESRVLTIKIEIGTDRGRA